MDSKLCRIINDLSILNDIEEIFIARVHIVMAVYLLSKGTISYKGNILNIQQDMQSVLNKLKRLMEEVRLK